MLITYTIHNQAGKRDDVIAERVKPGADLLEIIGNGDVQLPLHVPSYGITITKIEKTDS